MLERQIINGRPASIAYLRNGFQPATRDDYEVVKVMFDDGEQWVLKRPPASQLIEEK